MSRKRKQPVPVDLYDLMTGPIRLACMECDRDDMDGITEEQLAALTGWEDVHPSPAREDDVWAWWTHMGTCDECTLRIVT